MHLRSLLLSSVSSTVLTVLVEVPLTRRSVDRPCAVSLASRKGILDELVILVAAVLGACGCSCYGEWSGVGVKLSFRKCANPINHISIKVHFREQKADNKLNYCNCLCPNDHSLYDREGCSVEGLAYGLLKGICLSQ